MNQLKLVQSTSMVQTALRLRNSCRWITETVPRLSLYKDHDLPDRTALRLAGRDTLRAIDDNMINKMDCFLDENKLDRERKGSSCSGVGFCGLSLQQTNANVL